MNDLRFFVFLVVFDLLLLLFLFPSYLDQLRIDLDHSSGELSGRWTMRLLLVFAGFLVRVAATDHTAGRRGRSRAGRRCSIRRVLTLVGVIVERRFPLSRSFQYLLVDGRGAAGRQRIGRSGARRDHWLTQDIDGQRRRTSGSVFTVGTVHRSGDLSRNADNTGRRRHGDAIVVVHRYKRTTLAPLIFVHLDATAIFVGTTILNTRIPVRCERLERRRRQ